MKFATKPKTVACEVGRFFRRARANIPPVAGALLLCGVLAGCGGAQPQIIARASYQEVDMPVRCEVELPPKPKFHESDPSTAGEIAAYYEEIERLLLLCVGEKK